MPKQNWSESPSESPPKYMRDLRKSKRYRADLPCQIRYGNRSCRGTMRDISVGGAFMESEIVPFRGEPVAVEICINRMRAAARFVGKVAHGGRYLTRDGNIAGFGLKFLSVDVSARSILARFIAAGQLAEDSKLVFE